MPSYFQTPSGEPYTHVINWTYNAATLTMERMQQPVLDTGSVNIASTIGVTGTFWPTTQAISAVQTLAATPASGSVANVGNNTLVTPAAGKKLRLFYCSYNPNLAVEVAFRFGAAGTLFLRNSVAANSIVAKDFGDFRYIEGGVNDLLILNLSIGVTTIWNALYVEV